MKMQNVEDIYPLSPMQQGLLFHTRSAPESALYFEQWTCVLQGNLDISAFQRAWQRVVDRHTPLRTFFLYEDLDQPLQVVRQQVQVPWEQQDWRGQPAPEQHERLDALLQADQQRGFDLARAPLMRLQLIRMTGDTYQFIWSFHHVLLDGWSIALVFEEVVACYTAFCQGQEPQLKSRPPYRAQIAWLQQQDLAQAELFWRQALKGVVAATPLTVDRPQRAGASHQGYANHQIALPATRTTALQSFARAHQLTLSTLVQGAWALLLSRYSGEQDVVFGVVVSGRPIALPEADSMIGLFVNTLPARVHVPPDAALLPWLRAFQDQQIEARQYEYSPLVQVQGWSEVRRGQPLFESLVTFENYPAGGFALQSTTGTVAISAAQIIERTNYPLTISIIPGEQLALKFMYDTGRFDAAAISRLAGHFQTLLESMVAGPQQRLADLVLLTATERQQLLVEWNATQQTYPQNQYLHTTIEAQAERTPEAVALVFEHTQLTYRELNQRANQLAHHLRTLGVGPDTLVGISMERSLELVVGLLGILKAGGAYVPLDPAYPRERLAFMLEDSQTRILLTQHRLLETLSSATAAGTQATDRRRLICLDTDWPAIASEPVENLTNVVGPDHLAYMIYTSGSTGKPKGAMNTHAAISNRLLWMQAAYQLTAADRVLQKTPFSFDVSVWEFFWPLMNGARLVVARPGGHQDSAYLVRLIAEQQITTLHFVPSMLQVFLEEPQLERCASLKRVICSGEALPFDLQERFFSRLGAELHNLYGPTEAAVDVTYWACQPDSELRIVPIGQPIANTQMYILDAQLQPLPVGVAGELHIGGIGLARGYHNRPELTDEKFIANPFADLGFSRKIYKTGDLARYLPDGNIEYLGRIDHQVKLRGFRIELGEIEAVLREHAAVADAVVAVREDAPGDKRLVAYVVPATDAQRPATELDATVLGYQLSALGFEALRSFLKERLPEYMLPSAFMTIPAVPISPNGKADRRALPVPEALRPQLSATYAAPQTAIERTIATIWQAVLHIDAVGLHDNFFDLGGHSLLVAQVYSKLRDASVGELSMVDLFQYPTVSSLARYLSRPPPCCGTKTRTSGSSRVAIGLNNSFASDSLARADFRSASHRGHREHRVLAFCSAISVISVAQPLCKTLGELMDNPDTTSAMTGLEIAVIGMAGRFPGAPTIEAFWQNLCDGVESIAFFSDQELRSAGVEAALLRDPNYVRAGAILDDIDLFDAAFFSMSPREADITDPQQRLFLECAWEALESAGYNPYQYPGAIGVYAGVGMSSYASANPQLNRNFIGTADDYQTMIGNQKDFLATRVAYKLNLRGPSLSVQTACSTSLVAVHLASQGLIGGDSDIALAGGVSIRVPHRAGYLHQTGGVTSPDGHCRAFDAQAQGTAIGSGVGVVVLKRLEDALADGDSIYAVIKGSAVNNDGAQKVGYMAPSPDGQARVIRAAQRTAEVEPDTIGYVETHGTGTSLGDPIEISALTQAFQTRTQQKGFCAVGSLKTNIGHLDVAAGVAGLIKAILALKHQQIPPSLHFERSNPAIDFANSPFYVNTALAEWKAQSTPRRAGVSAFGIGGTNAHVILEEAPRAEASSASRPWQLLLLSARSAAALDHATANLAEHFRQHPDSDLADAAYTLQTGRHMFHHRRVVICRDQPDALAVLETSDFQRMYTAAHDGHDRPVIFMFPGGGAQYVDMGRELYQSEPVFREQLDRCILLLRPHIQLDLAQVLYPNAARAEECARQLRRSSLGLPLLFAIEYALAQLWMSWGIQPQALIGHSLGEYVAACLAGVLQLEDALALVALRGRLFEQLPPGAMLSVPLSEQALLPLLDSELSLAAINGPAQSVASGPAEAIERLAARLAARGVASRRLQIDVAAHSAMLTPILQPFARFIATLRLQAPTIPYISNVTGDWITAAEATDPQYWVRHLRQTVRFSAGIQQLVQGSHQLFLEVGPGRTLTTLVKQHPAQAAGLVALSSLRHPADQQPDAAFLMTTLGRLWLAGALVEWNGLYTHERRQRVPLPTYPFERRRHWLAAPNAAPAHARTDDILARSTNETRPEHIPNLRLVSGHGSTALHDRPVLPTTYVAPRDEIEQILAGIWQQVLGIEQVGVHDNFFELGGDSLQAVQMIAKLHDVLPVELSPHSLLQSPTIMGLTQAIAALGTALSVDATQAGHTLLINIRPAGDKPPLFLIHPIGGGVYIYRDLVRALEPNRPVYGLQAQGFDAKSEPLTRVEDMAARYIDALRAVQPAGPYLLGGSSFGGVVAFEIAQQLCAAGYEVALLALIDTAAPAQLPAQLTDEHAIIAFALGTDMLELPERLRQSDRDERLRYYLEQARAAGTVPADFGLPEFRQFLRMVQAHLQAMRSYTPRAYPGAIVFFRAATRDRLNPPGPEQGWIGLAAEGIEIHEVPGDHITMNYAPHVELMAELLNRYLEPIDTAAVYAIRP